MTGDDILTSVLDKCRWPLTDGEAPLTHAQILNVCDLVISGDIWPEVIASHGDYGINTLNQPMTANVARYRLPSNLYGPIRTITIVLDDDTDNELDVVSVNLSDVGRLRELPSSPSGYYHYIDGDYCVLYPKPTETANTLRIRFYRHPLKLCKMINAATVYAIFQSGPHAIDLEKLDPTASTDVPASWVSDDVMSTIRAGNGHQVTYTGTRIVVDHGADNIRVYDPGTDVAAINASDMTAGDDIQETVYAPQADYIAVNGHTPIAQIPDHMLAMMLTKTAEECFRAAGDRGGMGDQYARGVKLENLARQASKPRSQADSGILVSRNSQLRGSRSGFGWNRW